MLFRVVTIETFQKSIPLQQKASEADVREVHTLSFFIVYYCSWYFSSLAFFS